MGYIANIQFAPIYVAMERGYFKDAGIDIKLEPSFNETDGLTRIGVNQLQFGLISGDQVLLARAKRAPVVYVFRWYQRFPVGVVVPADSTINKPEDLAGRGARGVFVRILILWGLMAAANVALTPAYSSSILAWVQAGGVWAVLDGAGTLLVRDDDFVDLEEVVEQAGLLADFNLARSRHRPLDLDRRALAALIGGEVEQTVGRVGGGALPLAELPSFACALEEELARPLRLGEPPIVGIVRDGRLLLDCRTLTDDEVEEVAAAVTASRQ